MLSKHFARLQTTPRAISVVPQRNFALSEKQIKQRRKSVISIAKITKAMKMVAASKMRGELTRL
jgi:F-type H+-transporting ATPase subunit gamma